MAFTSLLTTGGGGSLSPEDLEKIAVNEEVSSLNTDLATNKEIGFNVGVSNDTQLTGDGFQAIVFDAETFDSFDSFLETEYTVPAILQGFKGQLSINLTFNNTDLFSGSVQVQKNETSEWVNIPGLTFVQNGSLHELNHEVDLETGDKYRVLVNHSTHETLHKTGTNFSIRVYSNQDLIDDISDLTLETDRQKVILTHTIPKVALVINNRINPIDGSTIPQGEFSSVSQLAEHLRIGGITGAIAVDNIDGKPYVIEVGTEHNSYTVIKGDTEYSIVGGTEVKNNFDDSSYKWDGTNWQLITIVAGTTLTEDQLNLLERLNVSESSQINKIEFLDVTNHTDIASFDIEQATESRTGVIAGIANNVPVLRQNGEDLILSDNINEGFTVIVYDEVIRFYQWTYLTNTWNLVFSSLNQDFLDDFLLLKTVLKEENAGFRVGINQNILLTGLSGNQPIIFNNVEFDLYNTFDNGEYTIPKSFDGLKANFDLQLTFNNTQLFSGGVEIRKKGEDNWTTIPSLSFLSQGSLHIANHEITLEEGDSYRVVVNYDSHDTLHSSGTHFSIIIVSDKTIKDDIESIETKNTNQDLHLQHSVLQVNLVINNGINPLDDSIISVGHFNTIDLISEYLFHTLHVRGAVAIDKVNDNPYIIEIGNTEGSHRVVKGNSDYPIINGLMVRNQFDDLLYKWNNVGNNWEVVSSGGSGFKNVLFYFTSATHKYWVYQEGSEWIVNRRELLGNIKTTATSTTEPSTLAEVEALTYS